MKIEKQYIANNYDKETQTCKIALETPWDQTSTAYIYSRLDDALPEELKGIPAVVQVSPISYNNETKTFVLEVVIDVQDIDFEDEE